MLSFYSVWKPFHFNYPFYNFAQGLTSGSLIHNCRICTFPWLKIGTVFASLQSCDTSPLPHHSSEVTVAGLKVSPPSSLQLCDEAHLSQGTRCSEYSPYLRHQFPCKLVCSTLSSLNIIVFDAEDGQNRNAVVLPPFCHLLSPSVSSRGPTPSCLFFLLVSMTFKVFLFLPYHFIQTLAPWAFMP